MTYQDYTLKQEKTKPPKMSAQLPKQHTLTTFESTPFSISNRPKTASTNQAMKPAIQNFMVEKMLANIESDDSLLQNS